MPDLKSRRPLTSRNTKWAAAATRWLAAQGATPNAISQAGMGAALIAGLAFWATRGVSGPLGDALLLILGALGCQVRLLCNLFDGMIAVEAGKGAPDGPLWNEFPDRISDLLILTGVGLGVGLPWLGLAAAAMAVLTAYTRELGSGIGLPPDFCGPMAKQHRMAALTVAAGGAILLRPWLMPQTVLAIALALIALGAAATALRRAGRIRASLLAAGLNSAPENR